MFLTLNVPMKAKLALFVIFLTSGVVSLVQASPYPSYPMMSSPMSSPEPTPSYSNEPTELSEGFTTTFEFYGLAEDVQNAAIQSATSSVDPDPQGTSQRSTQTLRNGAISRLGGIHAGVEAPMLADEGGDSLHFEYNYIDTALDNAGVGIAGESNVFALGYERYLGGGIYLDLSYEYGNETLRAGAANIDNDTHTVAASLSADLVNNIYGFLIVGGSWADGATNLAGAQIVGTDGSTFFINPGLGTSRAFGDIVVDGAISYLYQNSSTTSIVSGIPLTGGADVGQLVVDLGATYNFTDSLYARVGLQYNNILDDNFGAIAYDKNWLQVNSEIGARIGANSNVYVGHAYDAGHNIYDTHTYRAGFSYGF